MNAVQKIKAAAAKLDADEQVELFRWWVESDVFKQRHLASLKREIGIGLEDLERGRYETDNDANVMKLAEGLKKPFGTAKMVDLTAVRYLAWEDAFEVDFEDGLTFLEPHATIRKANRISPKARWSGLILNGECHEGFFVHYDNGQTAEVSWAFIRERPPEHNSKRRAR